MYETITRLCEINGKLEAIIESSTNGIFEIDNTGKIISANAAFFYIFDIHQKNNYVYLDQILQSESILGEVENLFARKEEISAHNFIIDTVSKIEKLVHVKLLSIPHKDETFIIGIVQDKTEVLTAMKNREYYIKTLQDTISELKVDNKETIYHLAHLVELRDNTTGKHLERVEQYTRILGMRFLKKFGEKYHWISQHYIEDMATSSVLHDIGKIGISDTILLKPDKLTDEEYELIKEHTTVVGEALKHFKGKKDFLAMGREIGQAHHEKWNGTGYPSGLKGTEIPLSARIVSVCDVYDALVSERPYKKALSHEEAIEIILSEKGTSFDPEIIEAFSEIHDEFHKVHKSLI